MAAGIYQSIDNINDMQTFALLDKGTYTFTGADPLNVFDLLDRGSYQIAVITFVDTASADANDKLWLQDATNSIAALYNNPAYSSVLFAAILYKSSGTLGPTGATGYLAWQPAGGTFFAAYNATFASFAADHFRSWMLDAVVTPPFTYVIRRGNKFIADKIQRRCRYNGESTYAPASDMLRLDWDPVASAATNATMYGYLNKRLTDHLAVTPTITVKPAAADSLAPGGLKIKDGSKICCSFSEKAVGAATPSKFIFSDGAADVTDVIAPIVPSYEVAWVNYIATNPPQSEPDLERAFTTLPATGTVLTLRSPSPSAGLVDTTGLGFTSSSAFVVDPAGDTAACELKLSDGTTTFDLMPAGALPVVTAANRTLTARVITAYPTFAQPTGRVIMPDGTLINAITLNFSNYAASIDETEMTAEGVYTVVIDAFKNNAGQTMAAVTRRFVVADTISAHAKTHTIEGWGYYPREEGLPTNAVESTTPGLLQFGDAGWAHEGAGAGPAAPAAGARLAIPAAVGANCFSRSYSSIFGKDFSSPGNGISYVEAGFAITSTPTGAAKLVKALDGSDLLLKVLGVGMEIWNGPLKLSLVVVDAGAGPVLAARVLWESFLGAAEERYKLSAITIDQDLLHIVRASCDPSTGDYKVHHVEYAAADIPPTPVTFTDEMTVLHNELITVIGAPYTAGVRFGVLGVCNQTMSTQWEFVRYGFFDSNYALGDTSLIGLVHAARAGDAPFYRSTDILVAGSDKGDPAPAAVNPVQAVMKSGTLGPAPSAIPYKVRFFVVDWNDSTAGSSDGFLRANFPSCYKTYGALPNPPGFSMIAPGPAIVAGSAAPGTASLPVTTQWQFNLLRDRLSRRIFILAYVDSPLMPTPELLPNVPAGSLIVDDDPAKSDFRCAVRQFLPDFYVRDTAADTGGSPGGSLSPDLAMAVFNGTIDGMGNHILSNPQDTMESHYPKGFAKGDPAPYDYTPTGTIPIDSTNPDPTKKIKITDTGWSDYGTPATQCFYNRVWVRLSNRGVVPGPASVQVFYLGSLLRAAFDPAVARGPSYPYALICANQACTQFVQKKFQYYDPATGALAPALIDAVPALSGASDPASVYRFVIAEFLWHVAAADVPASAADSHGCRAGCINIPKPASVGGAETWSSGIDQTAPLDPAASVWGDTVMTNNITVRNSNITQATPPLPSDHVTYKMRIIHNIPKDHRKIPNDFVQTFGRPHAEWSLALDAGSFGHAGLVLRIDAAMTQAVKARNFTEVFAEDARAPGLGMPGVPSYRFFTLKGGLVGSLEGIMPKTRPHQGVPIGHVSIFYLLEEKAEGRGEIFLTQKANGREIGGYRTVIDTLHREAVRLVADTRTGVLYSLDRNPGAMHAIPYENRGDYLGAGFAVQDGMLLAPVELVNFLAGKLPNEMTNFPKGFRPPKPPAKISLYPGRLEGAVVGQVVNGRGEGMPGWTVSLHKTPEGPEAGRAMTDSFGRYLILVRSAAGSIDLNSVKKEKTLELVLRRSGVTKGEEVRSRFKAYDLFVAPPVVQVKE